MFTGILVVIVLGSAPTPTSACCAAQAVSLVWPSNGMEEVPVDAAVVLYGKDLENPSGDWELLLESETGEPVPFTATRTLMADDYFLIVVVPDETLAPNNGYTGVFSQDAGDEMPGEFSFRTGSGAGEPPPQAPVVDYQGLGVPMWEADGGGCGSSTTEGEAALTLVVSGEELDDRLIRLEVRDSQEEAVFERLLGGTWMLDTQLVLGGDICAPLFPLEPCERYCVRAAALDHLGEPGPWSDWSCSDAIGYWVCGDYPVIFGEEIPEGLSPTDEVAACMPAPEVLSGAGAGSPRGPDDGSAAGDDPEAACTANGTPSSSPWGLFVLVGAVVLLSASRRRWPTASREVSLVLLCAGLLSAGCGERSPTTEPIDPASLSPDELVFAVGWGGGFARTVGDMFYWSHHPDFTLYVFGDRRLVYLDRTTIPTLGYRVWREGTIPEETFAELLGLAVAVDPDHGGSYQRCPAADGGTEVLFVGLPGLSVTASCFTSFGGCDDEGRTEPADWETPPPDALVDLAEALAPLRFLPGEIVETDRILLGVQPMDDPYWDCDLSNAVPWPFDEPAFPGDLQEGGYGTTPLDPPLAGQVRDFLRDHLEDHEWGDRSTCVSRDGQAHLVFYDDMLPGEEGYPF